jgi:hypothetical protein
MDRQESSTVLITEIAGLAELRSPDLRSLWRTHYPSDPPKRMSRELMARAIAYRLQEKSLGGLSRRAKAKLKVYSSGNADRVSRKSGPRNGKLKPGAQLVRQWGGRIHIVTAASDGGLIYDNERYRSLSQIARTITGARWSGPAFFGLKSKDGAEASSL